MNALSGTIDGYPITNDVSDPCPSAQPPVGSPEMAARVRRAQSLFDAKVGAGRQQPQRYAAGEPRYART